MVKVRFAPSPTGYLHVGGVRTTLFNYLFARKNNGKLVLRIEDTDFERSKKEYEDIIINDLKWCGIDYDEGPEKGGDYGPYRQSERLDIYRKYVDFLIKEKKAYYAVYNPENNEEIIHKSFEFPQEYSDKKYSISVKFKVPENTKIVFDDMIKGNMEFDTEVFDDFVIQRSSGIPMYNFTVVIDDYLMKITHVIRGEDHISNTPKQIMLYDALGFEKPVFAHIPLILGEDKAPLSKRHGGTSVTFFKEEGYLPDAVMNYLGILGWTVENEIFDFKDKCKDFDISMISNKSVVFDYKKLLWVNEVHLRTKSIEYITENFKNWLDINGKSVSADEEYLKNVLNISREKVSNLKQLFEFSENFFIDDFSYDEKYVTLSKKEWFGKVLEKSCEMFENSYDYSTEGIEKVLSQIAETGITGRKNVYQTVRGAILGKLVTPGLYESISVLGKEKTIRRIKRVKEELL